MKRTTQIFASAAVALLLSISAGAVFADNATLDAREKAMKTMGGSMKKIKQAIADGAAADVVDPANTIAEIAATIPSLFPEGSDTPDDEAKPDIWQNWEDFTAKAKSLGEQAAMLSSAGQGGDLATIGAQFEKVGGACGACHKAYREQN